MPPMNLLNEYGLKFIPFRLLHEQTPIARNFMGGSPKRGVTPPLIEPATKHLCTLGLVEGLDVSLFSTFDYNILDSRYSFFPATYKMHDESNPLVQFVVHPEETQRDDHSPLKNSIKALELVFGEVRSDPPCEGVEDLGAAAIYSDHKVGGLPFFNQIEGEVGKSLQLLRDGFVHLLQITFPSNADSLSSGNWPFGESAFHVFARHDALRDFRFYYCWG